MSGTLPPPVIQLPPVTVTARRISRPPPPLQAPPPLQGPVRPESVHAFPLPDLRRPRGGVAINGKRIDKWLVGYEVTNNRYFTADQFNCTLALRESDPAFGLKYWSDQGADGQMQIEFFASLDDTADPGISLLAGRVDQLRIDLARRTVSLNGRDHTADLIEGKLAEKFQNNTASQIATILAGRYGLTPVVTETRTLAGVYYRREHASLNDETTAWNLVTYLAEREGFDVFVRGRELHFQPPPDPAKSPVWVLQYEPSNEQGGLAYAPTSALEFNRSLTASRDISVKVISWNSTRGQAITAIHRSRARQLPGTRSSPTQSSTAASHVFRIPGLTQEQADREAERLHHEITKNMRSFTCDLPGDPRVAVDTVVRVRGTGGSFDCDYHIDEITRRFDQESGFTMRIEGRNIVAEDQASL